MILTYLRQGIAALFIAGGTFLIAFSIYDYKPNSFVVAVYPVTAAFGLSIISIGWGLWTWPKSPAFIVAGLIGTILALPLGHTFSIFFLEPYDIEDITGYFHLSGVLSFVGVIAISYGVLRLAARSRRLTASQVSSPAEPTTGGQESPAFTARLWNQRHSFSRGAYIASILWLLALIFAIINSGAFTRHLGSFFLFLIIPIAILFTADHIIGKRGRAT